MVEEIPEILKDSAYTKDFVLRVARDIQSKFPFIKTRQSKNGVFLYGEKRTNHKGETVYKYDTYFTFEEIPTAEQIAFEISEFKRYHGID